MADDELEALDALEREASEFTKVRKPCGVLLNSTDPAVLRNRQDAEIDRIRSGVGQSGESRTPARAERRARE